MRKWVVSVLMIPLLLLSGCGEREARLEKTFDAFREKVTMAASITAQAALAVDNGGTAAAYTIHLSYDGKQTDMEVIEPEILSGVTAHAVRGETSVEYGSVLLGTGPLDGDGLTPVSALPVMLDAMASGWLELLWWEADQAAARIYVGENSFMTLWLEPDTLTPTAAEITSDGRTVVTCLFSDWQTG